MSVDEGCEHFRLRYGASNLSEVGKLYLQRERAACKLTAFNAPDKLRHQMIKLYSKLSRTRKVVKESTLAPHRLALALYDDGSAVVATRKLIVHRACFSKHFLQVSKRELTQLQSREHPYLVHTLGCSRPHSPELLHRQTVYELLCAVGMHRRKAVGLAPVGCYLGKKLVVAHPAMSTPKAMPGLLSVTSRNASSSDSGSTMSVY